MAGSSTESNHFSRCRNNNPHPTDPRLPLRGPFVVRGTGPASTSRTRQANPIGLLAAAAAVEALARKGKSRLSCSPGPDLFPELSHGLRSHHPRVPGPLIALPASAAAARNPPLPSVKKPSRSGNLPAQPGFSQAIGVPDAPKKRDPSVEDPRPTTDFRNGADPPRKESGTRS